MRRKDREITDFHEMIRIMKKCDTCRLALFDDEFPYIVPLCFGIDVQDEQLYLYFHSAKKGKKLDLIEKNNKVSFEMDCEHNIILYEERMSCTMGYASVMGQGTIEWIKEEDKFDALKIIMRQYHAEDFEFRTELMKVTTVFRLKISRITGKRRNNIHPNEKTKTWITLDD